MEQAHTHETHTKGNAMSNTDKNYRKTLVYSYGKRLHVHFETVDDFLAELSFLLKSRSYYYTEVNYWRDDSDSETYSHVFTLDKPTETGIIAIEMMHFNCWN